MQKILLLVVFTIFTFQSKADDVELFSVDEVRIEKEFRQLNQLEKLVYQNNFQTETILLNSRFDKNLVCGKNVFQNPEPDTILPPFLWGCLTGPIGMVVVYSMTEGDKKMLMKSLWGCALGGCVWIPLLNILFGQSF